MESTTRQRRGTTARDYTYTPGARRMKINALDMIKYAIRFSLCQTPEGKLLEIQLCSLYSPVRNTGVINPLYPRLMAFSGGDTDALARAMRDLEHNGGWSITRDSQGVPATYTPPFMDHLRSTQAETKRRVHGSGDNFIMVARYLPCLTPIQRMAALMCLATIRMRWNFLGSTREHTYFRSPAPDNARIVLSTAFTHPILDASGLSACRALLATEHLPHDITPLTTAVPYNWLRDHVGCSGTELFEHLDGPCADMFEFRPDIAGGTVHFLPRYEFNQSVWGLERIPGGSQRNAWELAQGFSGRDLHEALSTGTCRSVEDVPVSSSIHDAPDCRPPLGFHWLYEVVVDGRVVLIGQTTQTLTSRLHQHLRRPTNAYAHNSMRQWVEEGKHPVIRATALVHAYEVSDAEVDAIDRAVKGGADLLNYVTDAVRNQRTIAMDSRFEGWDSEAIESFLQDRCDGL